MYGSIVSFEPQIDKENGSALGIVFIKYGTHEDAKKCVAKENGKRLGAASGLCFGSVSGGEGEEIRVVLDGEGMKLKAVLRELDERKKREREEKKRKEKEAKLKEANANLALNVNEKAASTSTPNSNHTPAQNSWKSGHLQPDRQAQNQTPQEARQQAPQPSLPHGPHTHPLPLPPHLQPSQPGSAQVDGAPPSSPNKQISPARVRRPPPAALVKARMMAFKAAPVKSSQRFPLPSHTSSHSSSSTPLPSRSQHVVHSRSPSPISHRPAQASESAKQRAHEDVVTELARNKMDHVRIELGGAVREEDVRQFFEGFKVQKVCGMDSRHRLKLYILCTKLFLRYCTITLAGISHSRLPTLPAVPRWY